MLAGIFTSLRSANAQLQPGQLLDYAADVVVWHEHGRAPAAGAVHGEGGPGAFRRTLGITSQRFRIEGSCNISCNISR